MIVKITQDVMELYCPFTRDVKGGKTFDSYEQALKSADAKLLSRMLGSDLYAYLETNMSSYAALKESLQRFICNEAAWTSAGKHDLRQTPNGFGTVSGQQEVVASTARVNAMKLECRKAAVKAWDDIVTIIEITIDTDLNLKAKVLASEVWKRMTNQLVYINDEMDELVNTYQEDSFDEVDKLDKYDWHLSSVWAKVANLIGRDTLLDILKHRREHTIVDKETEALGHIKQWLGVSINKEGNPFAAMEEVKRQLLYVLDKNLTTFPKFSDSITYKGMHTAPFESEKKDASFWF